MDQHTLVGQLGDDDLIRRTAAIVACSRANEAEMIVHLAEVDARRLWARQACPSMFAYCTEVLHFSEAEAFLRIGAARASREHPVLLAMLADGRLHLSGIARLAPHLTEANRHAVLARAVHRTKRQIEELVAELAPQPDTPASIRKLPQRCVARERTSDRERCAPGPPSPAPDRRVDPGRRRPTRPCPRCWCQ